MLEVLRREGYIRGYETVEHGGGKPELSIELKYHNGEPVIRELRRVSKPGPADLRRASKDLPSVYNGLGIAILSTPRGVLSDAEAREARVGGEVLCTVF